MAVTRPPRKPQAVATDDKAAEEFIKGGGAPVLAADRGVRREDEAPEPKAPAVRKERKPDLRETPRFSIRLEQELLDEIDANLDAAKAIMRIPKHIRLTKSDFIEWCIREGLDKVKKSAK